MEPTLIIMAAGIGSRYGAGIKQLAIVGPSNEIIMDYSLYDAKEAGFNKIIFIIRKDIEQDFKNIIGNRIEKYFDVKYAFQDVNDIPNNYSFNRVKPWGTGHAILSAKNIIDGPFVVINADDYYGKEGFKLLYNFLQNNNDSAMVGFVLKNTLSDNGKVTRGICISENNYLKEVHETKNIQKMNNQIIGTYNNEKVIANPNSIVSMNMWAFQKSFVDELKNRFPIFLNNMSNPEKDEFLIPIIVDDMLKENKLKVSVLPSNDKWLGITYIEDLDAVRNEFINKKEYPSPIFI